MAPESVPAPSGEPRLLYTLRGDRGGRLAACCLVPGNTRVLCGSSEGEVVVWPLESQRLRPLRLGCHEGPVHCVAAAPGGKLLGSASADRTVRLWRNSAGKQSPDVIRAHCGAVRSLDFSHNGRRLLTASDDKTVKIWSLPDGKFAASLTGHTHWVRSAVFSPGGELAASGGDDKSVRIWDLERRAVQRSFHDLTDTVNCVSFDLGGSCVAGCSRDSTINIWDIRAEVMRQHYGRAHGSSPVAHVEFHPSSDLLLSCAADKTLRVWDLRAGRLLYTVLGHERPVLGCGWSEKGDRLVSCDDQLIHLWAFPEAPVAAAVKTAPPRPWPSQPINTAAAVPGPAPVLPNTLAAAEPGPAPVLEGREVRQWEDAAPAAPWGAPEPPACTSIAASEGVSMLPIRPSSLPHTATVPSEQAPEIVARALEQMVRQMELITASLQSLDTRLERTEFAVAELSGEVRAKRKGALATGACSVAGEWGSPAAVTLEHNV